MLAEDVYKLIYNKDLVSNANVLISKKIMCNNENILCYKFKSKVKY